MEICSSTGPCDGYDDDYDDVYDDDDDDDGDDDDDDDNDGDDDDWDRNSWLIIAAGENCCGRQSRHSDEW